LARRRNLSPWAHWMLALESVDPVDPCPVDDPAALPEWRTRTRARLDALLGPVPDEVPLDVEVLDVEPGPGYRRERIVFDVEATMAVPAYRLVPDGRATRGPGVLAVHGHGPGKRALCALDAGPETHAGGTYAHDLAQQGYVVLAPDLRCFGERADWNPPDKYGCDVNLVHAVMTGTMPLTQNLWDLQRALDVLAAHPLVDDSRMGTVGFSYGGTLALFLAACDERVRAAVVSGFFSSWRSAHRVPWNMCGSQVLPGMLGALEHIDLGALVAPRALLVESGRDDPLFPVSVARAELARLQRVYDSGGVGDRLTHSVFAGGHQWDGSAVVPFLARWLAAADG
jgi:dienelactone hydrolase